MDIVLVGTLLRSGQGLRVSMQLLEAPDGTVLWSHQTQVSLGDLFQLQDDVAQRIVESLASPLVTQELSQARRDTPATAQAYEYYLRGNQLSAKGHLFRPDATEWQLARDFLPTLCRRGPDVCAGLGTTRSGVSADREVFRHGSAGPSHRRRRGLPASAGLEPRLPMVHMLYAYLEVEQGRAPGAMLRLLEQAKKRRADPELFAGLVHACRYCGLLEASLAAHEHAQRLDPKIPRVSSTPTGISVSMGVLLTVRLSGIPRWSAWRG